MRFISICLYACEAELENRMHAFELRCYRRLLNISYKDHVTYGEVCIKIKAAIGEYDELLTLVNKQKLRWFSNVSMSSGLVKTIGTEHSNREEKKRQPEEVGNNIKEWTGMDLASSTRAAEKKTRWK